MTAKAAGGEAPGAGSGGTGAGRPLRMFVAGATGYTGQGVVREACGLGPRVAGGLEVTAHVRPDSGRLAEFRETFGSMGARVDTTAWELGAMRTRLAELRPDVVFALLGTTRARGQVTGDTYESVDRDLTLMLWEGFAASLSDDGQRRCFVYLSSLGVGPGTRGRYLAARWAVESQLRGQGGGDGNDGAGVGEGVRVVPYLIVRPGMITGPDRGEPRTGERLAGAVVDSVFGGLRWCGLGRVWSRYASLDATTLARGMLAASLHRMGRSLGDFGGRAGTEDGPYVEGLGAGGGVLTPDGVRAWAKRHWDDA